MSKNKCKDCKHIKLGSFEFPCLQCVDSSNFEPKYELLSELVKRLEKENKELKEKLEQKEKVNEIDFSISGQWLISNDINTIVITTGKK